MLCCKTHNMKKVIYRVDTTTYKQVEKSSSNTIVDNYSYEDKSVKSTAAYNEKVLNKIHIRKVKSNIPISIDTNISIGQVVYQVPDTMIIFKEYRIIVRITKEKNISNTLSGISSIDGNVSTSNIQVSNQMEVILKDESSDDDPSFKIKQVNSDQQIIDKTDYTEWIFNVTPIKNGEKRLDLVISIIKNDHKKQIVYSDKIIVKNSEILKIESFWSKYWQWIISTLLIPFIIWLYKRFTNS